jgi:hypothetical protein
LHFSAVGNNGFVYHNCCLYTKESLKDKKVGKAMKKSLEMAFIFLNIRFLFCRGAQQCVYVTGDALLCASTIIDNLVIPRNEQ